MAIFIKVSRKFLSSFRVLFDQFLFYRSFTGRGLYGLIFIILIGGLLEGIGIGLFLPVINYASKGISTDRFSELVKGVMQMMGLPMTLSYLLLLLFLVFFLKGVLLYCQEVATSKIISTATMRLRIELVENYFQMNYLFFTNNTTGYLNNLITTEVNRCVNALGKYCQIFICVVYIGIYSVGVIFINWKVMAFALLAGGFISICLRFVHRLSRQCSIEVSESNASLQSVLIQTIYSFKYLKATNRFEPLMIILSGHIHRLARLTFKLGVLGGVFKAVAEPFLVLCMCSLIFYQVVLEQRPISESMVLLAIFYRAIGKMFAFQAIWQKINSVIGGAVEIQGMQERLGQNKERNSGSAICDTIGDIAFEGVSFSYGNNPVIFNTSLCIRRKKSIAIVGASGAGKTTIFDLLVGLLEPQNGQLCINDINFRDIDKNTFRSKLGYVTQEPVIYDDSIANNIALWQCDHHKPSCMERIKEAAALAHCSEFIENLPQGYETRIGDRGVRLSGGQRQRIAIARELMKRPEMIIFDEATSSLDTESERAVQESIAGLRGTMTIVLIAHRLSTVSKCDYIYVLSKGNIVEEGEFARLYGEEGGIFRKMCIDQNV